MMYMMDLLLCEPMPHCLNAFKCFHKLAEYNADSYGWFTTELFWGIIYDKETGYEPVD